MEIKAVPDEAAYPALLSKDSPMDFHDVLYGRRSVRNYDSRPVGDDILKNLVDAAVQAPSALDEQPWAFTIVTKPSLLDRISESAKAYLLRSAALGMGPSRFRNQLADPHFHIFYHAPALIVVSAVGVTSWATEDCALAAENLMLAAQNMGIGSCWIGFAQHWLQTADGKTMLELPDHYIPVAPIIVGYARSAPPTVNRRAPTIRWMK